MAWIVDEADGRAVPLPRPALSPVLRALAEHSPHYIVAKTQPPDGLILRLPDGSCWAVNAHPVRGCP